MAYRAFLLFLVAAASMLPAAPVAASGVESLLADPVPVPTEGWARLTMLSAAASLLYVVHVAQDHRGLGWRILFFLLGFPFTLILSFLVVPGSNRVLGIDLPRRHSSSDPRQGPAGGDATESSTEIDERKAAWSLLQSVLVGMGAVFFLMPIKTYQFQPIEDGRQIVIESQVWGMGLDPWLAYRREGVWVYSEPGKLLKRQWHRGQWQLQPSPELVLSLIALIVLIVLVVRDERRRERSERRAGAGSGG